MAANANGKFDLTVIGSGPGGYVAAIRAGQLGLKTAVVEKATSPGGTCLHRGCIPAKALLESAALAQHVKTHGAEMGVRAVQVEYDMAAAVGRSRVIANKLTGGVQYLLKKNSVDMIQGRGRLAAVDRVTVQSDEGAQELDAAHVVIATGSVMKTFPGLEFDRENITMHTMSLSAGLSFL